MNALIEMAHDYIELRRHLGFKMSHEQKYLLHFADFLEQHQAPCITEDLALSWAQKSNTIKPVTQKHRLSAVRGFARYCQGLDSRTEVPAKRLLPVASSRPKPYLYSLIEIQALLEAARTMPCHGKRYALLPQVYYTLFGLLSVTGLRLGEACNLILDDVDIDARVMSVRKAKFGRERLIALHPSTVAVLVDYLKHRQHHFFNRPCSDKLFVSSNGTAVCKKQVGEVFRKLSRQIGLRGAHDSHGPRLHDLRHTYAVKTLENWYHQGQDPERLLPILSTHLGHVSISDTYWYLENSPELMRQSVKRLEKRWEDE